MSSKYPITMAFPALAFLAAALTWLLSKTNRAGLGMITSSLSVSGVILTAGSAMFPFLMPSSSNPNSSLTLWDATSSHLTLMVMFWAAVIFVPVILLYTSWNYYKMWSQGLSLNLSNNLHLRELHCNNNIMDSLDVSMNTSLEKLYCSGNSFDSLDVSGNMALKELSKVDF